MWLPPWVTKAFALRTDPHSGLFREKGLPQIGGLPVEKPFEAWVVLRTVHIALEERGAQGGTSRCSPSRFMVWRQMGE